MNSEIKINKKPVSRKEPLRINARDLVLIDHKGEELLARVSNRNININNNNYVLYVLCEDVFSCKTTVFYLGSDDVRVGDIVTTSDGSNITILGICDVDITITKIKTHEE